MSFLAFGKPLPDEAFNRIQDSQSRSQSSGSWMRGWFSRSPPPKHAPLERPRSISPQRAISPHLVKPKPSSYAKSLRLNSDQLKTLKLKKGANSITFTITSSLQGKQTCAAKVFLWDYKTKVVISDVDGTITKYFFLM